MDPFLATGLILAVMAGVVFAFRLWVRAPRGMSERDPPGVRTVAVFRGDDPEFFRDDQPEDPFVGIHLFQQLCAGLGARGVLVKNARRIPFAQVADCVVEDQRFALVLERAEARWVAGVEWVPDSPAVRRHMALTHRVFSPPDGLALRRLLGVLHEWLQSHPKLADVRWHRKEKWLIEDASDPAEGPLGP
jgi:hypothetical protein